VTHLAAGRRRLAGLVFVVLWGLITHGTYAGTGDEPHYQMIAHSIVFDGDVDLAGDYSNLQNRALGGHFEGGAHIEPGKDGRLRPVHDVGMPLLFAPYYFAAYRLTEQVVAYTPAAWLARARLNFTVVLRHLLSFAMIGVTAAMAVLLFGMFARLSEGGSRPFGWALLLVLSPPILSHSFLFFTEIVSAAIALAVFVWLRFKGARHDAGDGERRLHVQALVAGAATGYLLLIHARNIGLIAGLMAVALLESRRSPDRRWLMRFGAGAAAMFALRTGVTFHFWGTWLTTPHARLGEMPGVQPLVAESFTRIAGWLFDQEHGLLPYAPLYLLAPAGWLALWRRQRELCVALTAIIASYVAVIAIPLANAHGWRGGWTPAARFLVPIAPFLGMLTFGAVARFRRLPAIVIVLVAVQVALDAVLWQHPGLFWNDGIGRSALLTFLDRDSGLFSRYVPSIFPPLDGRTLALVAVACIGWAVFSWVVTTKDTKGTAQIV
jgi:hypothetical protein